MSKLSTVWAYLLKKVGLAPKATTPAPAPVTIKATTMATGYLLPIGTILQFFTDQGVVLSGGKIYTYTAGTTTPVVTYTNSTLVTPNANPIILSASGRLPASCWVPSGTFVKMVLQDSSGNVISGGTIDNLQGINDPSALTQAGIGAVFYPQTAAEVAAGVTPTYYFYPVGNVLRYAADPTGASVSSSAFTKALSCANSVFVPAGSYQVSVNLTTGQSLIGAGVGSGYTGTVLIAPAGSTFVIQIDATSTYKVNCSVQNMTINNVNSVANCSGIYLKGTSVTSLNDFHYFANLLITKFNYGIQITGRAIWCKFQNVESSTNNVGLYVSTDTTTEAFNLNQFISCQFIYNQLQGILITGYNNTISFIGCDVELNNLSNTAGVAAVDVSTSELFVFDNGYLESNGVGVAVTATYANNSIAFAFRGYCDNPRISNSYIVGSGLLIYFTSVLGGIIENNRLNTLSSGYVLVANGNATTQPVIFDSTNRITLGTIPLLPDVTGSMQFAPRQNTTCGYQTSAFVPDLLNGQTYICNGTFTISSIANAYPGATVTIIVYGTNTITWSAGLVVQGSTTVTTGQVKTYIVSGYPNVGKLIEIV